ncbi:MAG: hypothetical protein PHS92_00210 [Candidatus Gracilibacteria bacterium]|nr:hypothetical protein [Candidatus Gracilibacteria bacterium]
MNYQRVVSGMSSAELSRELCSLNRMEHSEYKDEVRMKIGIVLDLLEGNGNKEKQPTYH